MENDIRNFSQLRKFIQDNPQKATVLVKQWEDFVQKTAETNPEVRQLTTADDWYTWIDAHPEKNISVNLWVCKEVLDTMATPGEQHTADQTDNVTSEYDLLNTVGHIIGNMLVPLDPELMQDDFMYQSLVNKKQREWLKNNPGTGTDSQAYLDYMYGSFDTTDIPQVHKDAETIFRTTRTKQAKKYDEKRKRTYPSLDMDPAVAHLKRKIFLETEKRFALAKKADPTVTREKIAALVEEKAWHIFIRAFPEKSYAYLQEKHQNSNTQLRKGLQRQRLQDQTTTRVEALTKRETKEDKEENVPSETDIRDYQRAIKQLQYSQSRVASLPPTPPPQQQQPSSPWSTRAVNNINQKAANTVARVRNARAAAQAGRLLVQQGIKSGGALLGTMGGGTLAAIIGVIALVILFIFAAIFFFASGENTETTVTGLSLLIEGPDHVPNGSDITYTIRVSYTGSSDVILTNPIPEGTTLVSTTGKRRPGEIPAWSLRENDPSLQEGVSSQAPQTFPTELYKGYGFPDPTVALPMSEDETKRWEHLAPLAQKAARAVGIDVGIVGMWPWVENSFWTYMDNCNDPHVRAGQDKHADWNPNTFCPYWDGRWQVGLGNHPRDMLSFLKPAMEAMHPGESAQTVGQRVITESSQPTKYPQGREVMPITLPEPAFPPISLDDIITGARNGDKDMQIRVGILMKDEGIGLYLIAQNFKNKLASNTNLAQTMEGWSATYYYRNKIINHIAGIYKAGVTGTVLPGKNHVFSITLRPTAEDIRVVNKVFAQTSFSSKNPVSGPPVEGGSGNACTEPFEGTGHCSVANLKRFFDNDEKKAILASMVCKKESGSNPLALNTNCSTNDYSVGLFQINAVAHCPGAYGSGRWGSQSCDRLLDQGKRDACVTSWNVPEENIKQMLRISNNGTNWQPWGAYTHPSVGVAIKASQCGII